jgi:hypothetical protein
MMHAYAYANAMQNGAKHLRCYNGRQRSALCSQSTGREDDPMTGRVVMRQVRH